MITVEEMRMAEAEAIIERRIRDAVDNALLEVAEKLDRRADMMQALCDGPVVAEVRRIAAFLREKRE